MLLSVADRSHVGPTPAACPDKQTRLSRTVLLKYQAQLTISGAVPNHFGTSVQYPNTVFSNPTECALWVLSNCTNRIRTGSSCIPLGSDM